MFGSSPPSSASPDAPAERTTARELLGAVLQDALDDGACSCRYGAWRYEWITRFRPVADGDKTLDTLSFESLPGGVPTGLRADGETRYGKVQRTQRA